MACADAVACADYMACADANVLRRRKRGARRARGGPGRRPNGAPSGAGRAHTLLRKRRPNGARATPCKRPSGARGVSWPVRGEGRNSRARAKRTSRNNSACDQPGSWQGGRQRRCCSTSPGVKHQGALPLPTRGVLGRLSWAAARGAATWSDRSAPCEVCPSMEKCHGLGGVGCRRPCAFDSTLPSPDSTYSLGLHVAGHQRAAHAHAGEVLAQEQLVRLAQLLRVLAHGSGAVQQPTRVLHRRLGNTHGPTDSLIAVAVAKCVAALSAILKLSPLSLIEALQNFGASTKFGNPLATLGPRSHHLRIHASTCCKSWQALQCRRRPQLSQLSPRGCFTTLGFLRLVHEVWLTAWQAP